MKIADTVIGPPKDNGSLKKPVANEDRQNKPSRPSQAPMHHLKGIEFA
jgi:hypothetical protein